jgi:hypothetical protein
MKIVAKNLTEYPSYNHMVAHLREESTAETYTLASARVFSIIITSPTERLITGRLLCITDILIKQQKKTCKWQHHNIRHWGWLSSIYNMESGNHLPIAIIGMSGQRKRGSTSGKLYFTYCHLLSLFDTFYYFLALGTLPSAKK